LRLQVITALLLPVALFLLGSSPAGRFFIDYSSAFHGPSCGRPAIAPEPHN
jgi:hypothetical protein